MAKAAVLDMDLEDALHQPPAATAPRRVKEKGREAAAPTPPKNDTPVNFRWPATEVKAMKRAALEADMTMQDFLLSCFHSSQKAGK
jgi:hypothetical protein